jgi:ribonuclease HI
VAEIARFLGERTNNYAEWTAVELALLRARELGADAVDLRTDSELVARQIAGRYRVKHPDLKPIHARVMAMLGDLRAYTVGHVPRERNLDADRLSNVAIDERPPEG